MQSAESTKEPPPDTLVASWIERELARAPSLPLEQCHRNNRYHHRKERLRSDTQDQLPAEVVMNDGSEDERKFRSRASWTKMSR